MAFLHSVSSFGEVCLATDSALIMDAMELLHVRSVEGFCIVSSDSDHKELAARIQETGLAVYGFGQRDTAASFVAACDEFEYLDEEGAFEFGFWRCGVASLNKGACRVEVESGTAATDHFHSICAQYCTA